MTYLVWTLPALIVIGLIASGRASTLKASLIGLAAAILIAVTIAPVTFTLTDAATAMLRGSWIGWIVVPYILGGLLFWQIAMRDGDTTTANAPTDPLARRRLLFTACFLVGPFAESATGFGVGIIGTLMMVRRLDLPAIYLLAFSLLSQTMILWGGMGSGAIIAAAFARTDPTTLAFNSSFYLIVFNALWLPLYWRLASQAGVDASWREKLSEAVWLGASIAVLIGATALLGPETAMLAAYGPAIVLRFIADERPDRTRLMQAARRMLPFAVLISWLVITRLVPQLQSFLEQTGRLSPFAGTPIWSPLFHAGTWLVVGAVITALVRGEAKLLPREAAKAWMTGRLAVLTIIIFAMMAEVLSGSRIAAGLAEGMSQAFGPWAILLTPQISAIFGALANSGNAANGLFMASQASLAAEAGLNVAAVIAVQHIAALSLNMVSPVRMSIVCSLAGTPGKERDAYRIMMPFALVIMAVLLAASILIAIRVI